MKEIAPNIYVDGSIVGGLLQDPHTWLDNHANMPVRIVGGLHNLSNHDKKVWSQDRGEAIRIIESGTGREEVWFPPNWKSPNYISLDPNGNLVSHRKFERSQPTLVDNVRMKSLDELSEDIYVEVSVWYQEDVISRNSREEPAVVSTKLRCPVPDNEYIAGVSISVLKEFWRDGEWKDTDIGRFGVIFAKTKLNKPDVQQKALKWIADHCKGGFFPFGDPMFGDPQEEFTFLADICAKG